MIFPKRYLTVRFKGSSETRVFCLVSRGGGRVGVACDVACDVAFGDGWGGTGRGIGVGDGVGDGGTARLFGCNNCVLDRDLF